MRKKIIIIGLIVVMFVVGMVGCGNTNVASLTNSKIQPVSVSVKAEQPSTGMTENQALNTKWGNPNSKNKTTNASFGATEEWVYSNDRYVYLDKGIVKYIKIKDFPKDTTSKNPVIGMTSDEVLASAWGNPNSKNKTITTNKIIEQWVYSGDRYVYLDNGIVTSLQTH